jgi:hypothetical protein
MRVISSHPNHPYVKLFSSPLLKFDDIDSNIMTSFKTGNVQIFNDYLKNVKIFHLHWIEHYHILTKNTTLHKNFIDHLKHNNIKIAWTQHNSEPHSKDRSFHNIYQLWAEHVDLALHHSDWGRNVMMKKYNFNKQTKHLIIPHPHWGESYKLNTQKKKRNLVEKELRLPPCKIRLSIFGTKRKECNTELIIKAIECCKRKDIQLVLYDGTNYHKQDNKIITFPKKQVSREVYDLRLFCTDVIIFSQTGNTLLTTGVIGDAIGAGKAVISSNSWPFLVETLGDSALYYNTLEELVLILDRLTIEQINIVSNKVAQLKNKYDPTRCSTMLYNAFSELLKL